MNSNGQPTAEVSVPTPLVYELKLKIERDSRKGQTTIFLIGRFDSDHLEELKRQISISNPQIVLDLREVTIVDVEVVRFLVVCKARGAKIVHCSRYIREWMVRER
jgi:anti-anti-sigma regulatory factor